MIAPATAVGVVLVAAGSGTRLGRGEAKAFVRIAGDPILLHALRRVDAVRGVCEVVVVAPADRAAEAAALAASMRVPVRIVAGGASRHASVAAGLAALTEAVDVVLVHDAARYDAPAELFERVVAEVAARGDGVVPGLPVADTVKRVDAEGLVVDTPDRAVLRAVQTPQGFPFAALRAAYAATDADFTDDAAVWAAAGGAVRVVAGDARATKVTTPHDLGEAERRHGGGSRTGAGMDVHAFGDGEMHLAGLHWPGGGGLAGHSDGDAAAHALCDALLAAAGLGDIGQRYGTADPAWAGASGVRFLQATRELLLQHGWLIGNATVQIVGVRPRIGPRREEAERVLGAALRAPVSVSATTTDGLGFTGRGEGVAAFATALLHRVAGPAGAPIALTP